MTDIFLKLVNMSIAASWLVLAVILLRLLLKKAPKWLNPVFWGIVGLRLILPFSIESALSLIPNSEPIGPEILYADNPVIHSAIPAVNSLVNQVISDSLIPKPGDSVNPIQIFVFIASIIWVIGVVLMFLYTGISYLRLRKCIKTAIPLRNNIYQSENVASPFVLGLLNPHIYLPFNIAEKDMAHVIAHEQTHIKRHDHWIKPIGFLLLSLYWFNPIMWVAYILLCRDIELACDERVIKELGMEQRVDYSLALLACSVSRKSIAACPLAFGEVGVKERVKNVINYKKPAFWIIIVAVISCVIVAVCFLTNPKEQDLSFLNYENLISVASEAETLEVQHHLDNIGNKVAGKDIGKILDNANWKEKMYPSPLELSPDITIYFEETAELRFYESEPDLAMILADGGWRYYRMKNTCYGDIETLIKTSFPNDGTATQWVNYLLTFPVSDSEKTEYSEEIFEIEPFDIQFALPNGWSIGEYNGTEESYLYSGMWSRVGIFDENNNVVGAVGYNICDDGASLDEPMSVYHQIALGNDYQFNVHDTYEVVKKSDTSETATVEVYRSQVLDSLAEAETINHGIVACDSEKSVYVAFEFDSSMVTEEQRNQIANSVEFLENTSATNSPVAKEDFIGTVATTLNDTSKIIVLSDEDALIIKDLWESGNWEDGTAECINNVIISIQSRPVYYHSDCGTFNDSENEKHLSVDSDTKEKINRILEKYIELESVEKPLEENDQN